MIEHSESNLCMKCISKYTQGWTEWDDKMWNAGEHYCPVIKMKKHIHTKRPENCFMSLEYIVDSKEE